MTRIEDLVGSYKKSADTAKVILSKGLETSDVEEFNIILIETYKKELQEENVYEEKQKLKEIIVRTKVYTQNHISADNIGPNNYGNYNNCNFKNNKSRENNNETYSNNYGFWQIPLSYGSRKYTAFGTGLRNAKKHINFL